MARFRYAIKVSKLSGIGSIGSSELILLYPLTYLAPCQNLNLELLRTHGSTYAEALEMAEEVLEMLVESYQESSRVLPVPRSLKLYAA